MNEERIATGGTAALAMTEVKDLTPEQLGGEIRLLTSQARRMALSYGIQIGYRLRVAHDKVGPHGWAEWLKAETDFSPAAASRFEKLYEGYGADQGSLFGVGNKFPTLEKISVSNALRLLAVPEEEREQVAAEVDAAHISTRELEKALAERDEWKQATVHAREEAMAEHERAKELEYDLEKARRAVEDAEKRADDIRPYKEKLAEAERRVKELESRPVEVAVERDEEAITKAYNDAKKSAEKEFKKALDDVKTKLADAQAAQKKAEEEKERAIRESPLQAEAEAARREADELRRKLSSAESGAGEVAMLARMAQTNFSAAMDKLENMKGAHPETAAKLLVGMERIVAALGERVEGLKG